MLKSWNRKLKRQYSFSSYLDRIVSFPFILQILYISRKILKPSYESICPHKVDTRTFHLSWLLSSFIINTYLPIKQILDLSALSSWMTRMPTAQCPAVIIRWFKIFVDYILFVFTCVKNKINRCYRYLHALHMSEVILY